MSVSNLFSKNSYKIYVDDITLKNLNLSSDGNYKIKFPSNVPSGIASLSILAVDTIEGNLIILKWLEPSQTIPFDVINCNILNAQEEINCPEGITTLGYMECNICNIKKSNGSEITGFLTSPLQTENNIAYFLPPSRPTQDGQVLSSQINGTMSWVNNNISNFIPRSYLVELPEVILNSTTPNQNIDFTFDLIQGEIYTAIFNSRVVKLNPTGTFYFRAVATNNGSVNVNLNPFIAIQSGGFINLGGVNQDSGININFWFVATATGNNRIRCQLESDISSGGECLIQQPTMIITKCNI